MLVRGYFRLSFPRRVLKFFMWNVRGEIIYNLSLSMHRSRIYSELDMTTRLAAVTLTTLIPAVLTSLVTLSFRAEPMVGLACSAAASVAASAVIPVMYATARRKIRDRTYIYVEDGVYDPKRLWLMGAKAPALATSSRESAPDGILDYPFLEEIKVGESSDART